MMNLDCPLVVFDVETTGLNPSQDKIIQLAAVKIFTGTKDERREWLINPECHIPKESQEIHGISDEEVLFSPPFKDVSYEILSFFKGSDLCGYNALRFDVPLLAQEFKRVGVEFPAKDIQILDPWILYRMMEPHTLEKAYAHYCGKKIEKAHNAMFDTLATVEIVNKQFELYQDFFNSPSSYVSFCQKKSSKNFFDEENRLLCVGKELVINFGKYKGKTLKELLQEDPAYLQWIVSQDFPKKVKNVVQEVLQTK